ncbi:uncharacterized protein BDW43DRAFT_32146 [Aspergillus alliaceus]|uniref:uncharacterized protein n=1 Tax=Petromyces alliaceus TaxID=209559 RepID=UPI0012A48973|nr:uncharacterized protein BDW43DRAFT_32146 [Aspergillus alliaceus]KAB8235399.1 hypothetical protein BDW43DRAFT_32146 [Aspergillus alliaceus]
MAWSLMVVSATSFHNHFSSLLHLLACLSYSFTSSFPLFPSSPPIPGLSLVSSFPTRPSEIIRLLHRYFSLPFT